MLLSYIMNQSLSDAKVIFHFNLDDAIDARSLASSLAILADEYKETVRSSTTDKNTLTDDDYKLYISSIENNCILIELATLIGSSLLPSLSTMTTASSHLLTFTKNIIHLLQLFSSQPTTPPSLKQTERAEQLAKTALGYSGKGKLTIETKNTEEEIRITIDNSDLTSIAKTAETTRKALQTRDNSCLEKVFLELVQFNKTPTSPDSSRTTEKAIIPSVSPKPLPVFWLSSIDESSVKLAPINPTIGGYIVDVNIQTKSDGTPIAYRVLNIVSRIE